MEIRSPGVPDASIQEYLNISKKIFDIIYEPVVSEFGTIEYRSSVSTPFEFDEKTSIPSQGLTQFTEKLDSNPRTMDFKYILHEKNMTISYTVYGGMNDYLRNQPREISYMEGQSPPNDIDFVLKSLNNKEQKIFIDSLIWKIQNITSDKDDQARIAISLVQNIDYDWEGFETGNLNNKYPYEVLYTGSGVCGEKVQLLAYMLRELGYEAAILRFDEENHDAVGIKCPQQYSYKNSGYCFVETTIPTIITYTSDNYVSFGQLRSKPLILKISEGRSFDSVSEEYNDAVALKDISKMGNDLSRYNYNKWISLVNKYGLKK